MESAVPENSGLRYCRQCRKNMPSRDFINRTNTGYCIVCKTCRDRQLKRYYEKNNRISQYPYEEKKVPMEREEASGYEYTQKEVKSYGHDNLSDFSSTSASNSSMTSPKSNSISSVSPMIILQSRYRVVDTFSDYNSYKDVYVARLLYHRTVFQKKYRSFSH